MPSVTERVEGGGVHLLTAACAHVAANGLARRAPHPRQQPRPLLPVSPPGATPHARTHPPPRESTPHRCPACPPTPTRLAMLRLSRAAGLFRHALTPSNAGAAAGTALEAWVPVAAAAARCGVPAPPHRWFASAEPAAAPTLPQPGDEEGGVPPHPSTPAGGVAPHPGLQTQVAAPQVRRAGPSAMVLRTVKPVGGAASVASLHPPAHPPPPLSPPTPPRCLFWSSRRRTPTGSCSLCTSATTSRLWRRATACPARCARAAGGGAGGRWVGVAGERAGCWDDARLADPPPPAPCPRAPPRAHPWLQLNEKFGYAGVQLLRRTFDLFTG